MNWQPQSGTEAIASWINQGVLFALVLAVAAVVACAAAWAVGSLSANGAVVTRARTGVAVALAAALLLGGGFSYVQWANGQAAAFAGDPKAYGIQDAPQTPAAWEVLDLSARWTGNINAVRARDGLPPLSTDGGLAERARSCASSRAGQGGDCPRNYFSCRDNTGMLYGAWDYGPGDLDKLDQDLAEGVHPGAEPVGRRRHRLTLDPSADMRSAWVALRDNNNKKAVVVALLENGAGLGSGTNAAPSNDNRGVHEMVMAADGVQDWLSDASDDVLKRIAAGAVNANQWMCARRRLTSREAPARLPAGPSLRGCVSRRGGPG